MQGSSGDLPTRGHARSSQALPTGVIEPPCLSEFLLPTTLPPTFKRFPSVSTRKSTHSGSNASASPSPSPSPSSGRQSPAQALNTCTHFSLLQNHEDGRDTRELACLSCEDGDTEENPAKDGGGRFRLINLAGESHPPTILLPTSSQERNREAIVMPTGWLYPDESYLPSTGNENGGGRVGDLQDIQFVSRKHETSLDRAEQRVEENPSAYEIEGTTACLSDRLSATQNRNLLHPPIVPPIKQPDQGEKPAHDRTDEDIDPNLEAEIHYVSSKPTCSLNLVCYRSGSTRCERHQIQVALRSRFKDDAAFKKTCNEEPGLLVNDEQFFQALRHAYNRKMCSVWRRIFFLKTLCAFRLLSFTPQTRPVVVPLDRFVLQEVLYAYRNPSKLDPGDAWINWVFNLRQPDRRHALEFVEGWNKVRIASAGGALFVLSTLVGILWSFRGGDVQAAFTVAGFILTAGTFLLAILAIVSGIEAPGRPVF